MGADGGTDGEELDFSVQVGEVFLHQGGDSLRVRLAVAFEEAAGSVGERRV